MFGTDDHFTAKLYNMYLIAKFELEGITLILPLQNDELKESNKSWLKSWVITLDSFFERNDYVSDDDTFRFTEEFPQVFGLNKKPLEAQASTLQKMAHSIIISQSALDGMDLETLRVSNKLFDAMLDNAERISSEKILADKRKIAANIRKTLCFD